MDQRRLSKSRWSLSAEAFARFLARLDPDATGAGIEYERLRLMLVKFFDWRGAPFPEECADETINRVIRKIDQGELIQEIRSYCHGVARLVLLEARKRQEAARVAAADHLTAAAPAVEPEREQSLDICFERCLVELPLESRQTILQYYGEDKQRKIDRRKELAESLKIAPNALRSRAQRIRRQLEECIVRCLKN